MSQAADLTPPIDNTVEEEYVYFDFCQVLVSTATLIDNPTVTCTVSGGSGTDATPQARILNTPQITTSPFSGNANQAVAVLVGTMIADVIYLLQCVAQTSDGQTLSVWSHLPCVAPE